MSGNEEKRAGMNRPGGYVLGLAFDPLFEERDRRNQLGILLS